MQYNNFASTVKLWNREMQGTREKKFIIIINNYLVFVIDKKIHYIEFFKKKKKLVSDFFRFANHKDFNFSLPPISPHNF